MNKEMNKVIVYITVTLMLSISIITVLSIPLGFFPPLGKLLFPGNGIWNINEEVPKKEIISSSFLSKNVTVFRDQWGIPHIYGYNESDLAFALGYVHAQDRLFQMDLARRFTRGQLSEILGPSALEDDKFNLNKLMDYWTNETIKALEESSDPLDQKILSVLNSYSAGINYYIDKVDTLPLEFLFLNYKPNHWSNSDTIAFIKYMSEMLTWGYSDFLNILIKDVIGLTDFQKLFGYPLPYQLPICPDYGENFNVNLSALSISNDNQIDTNLVLLCKNIVNNIKKIPNENFFLERKNSIGSNNWAVDGLKTASGKPLLCNDMHLSFNLPGIWYEAHLIDLSPGADFNVYGFFLAGVPYPIVGHNSYCGWGMTNTAYDVIDWYFYDGLNETHYWYKGEEKPYSLINYQIKVKGEEPETFIIKNTAHGPVFDGLIDEEEYPEYANKVIACQWIGQAITNESKAIYYFAHAKNRIDFDYGSQFFCTPAQNIIYADIHGDIGIRPTGKVPIRNDTGIPNWHLGNGSMLYNGSAGQGEWLGYVPFANLPHSENPAQNYLISANQIIAGPEYLKNYTLQNPIDPDDGYRARRLNFLLSQNSGFTIEDMKEIQLDFYSQEASNLTSYLLDVINSISNKTTLDLQVYNILADWNYIMDKDTIAPSIFTVWLQAFHTETFKDELIDKGSPLMPTYAVLEWLTKNNATAKWFDNEYTDNLETRDDIILLTYKKSISALKNFFKSNDPTNWIWGDLHQLKINHITSLSSLGFGPIPIGGSSNTVCPFTVGSLWEGESLRITYSRTGASERMILDFSDLNQSVSIIPSGQRGITNSIHYIDQLLIYLQGEYHVQYFTADELDEFLTIWVESIIIFKEEG